jgi:ubiquinone/menaquinone biosynthesis C-methylase UbiE
MSGGRGAYDAAADAWVDGPARVYARLTEAMLDHSPVAWAGARVLDVGAGTAVACDVALRRGARLAIASDVAEGMLRRRTPSVPAVLADAARLPFADAAFHLVTAGFCLSHLPDPGAALAEWRRVAGAVVASAFAPGPPHPAKTAVDDAMASLGFVTPGWYREVKDLSSAVEDPAALTQHARAAGFRSVRVIPGRVDTGLDTPREIAAWRLGMAHLAPWVAGLAEDRRREVRAAAEDAVAGMGPVLIEVLVLSVS